MSDLYIIDNNNGGDLVLQNNDLQLVPTIYNQVYLTLFGSVRQGEWFGNEVLEIDNRLLGDSYNLLQNFVITSANISLLQSVIKRDLKYLNNFADVDIQIDVISHNRLNLTVKLKFKERADDSILSTTYEPQQIGIGSMIIGYTFIVQ